MAAILRFGHFEMRPEQRQLLADRVPLALGTRAFDLLAVLLENRDRIVSKTELLERAWSGVVVEENNLSVQVSSLRKLLGESAIVTVHGRGYRWTVPVHDASAAGPSGSASVRPSLAVLPFANLGGSSDQADFADGLADDIVANLARSPWLHVIAHRAARGRGDSGLGAVDLCTALGVSYLIKGSVRRAGATLRVSAELVHGASGETLWGERYDRPVDDPFAVQDEIATNIVGCIEPMYLKREELLASRRNARDVQHWDLLMRARWHYWRSTCLHNAESKLLLQRALGLRPNDVTALSLLALSLATDAWFGWAPNAKIAATEARRVALRAVAQDDRDSFAHFALGLTQVGFGQIDRAIDEQRRALELYPQFAAASGELGRLLAYSGRTVEGAAMIRRAMAASPTDPRLSLWYFGLAIASFVDEDHEAAARHAATAVAHRPDWYFNHYLLAACLSSCGELDAARDALAEGSRQMPRFSVATLAIGHPFKNPAHRDRYVAALRQVGWKG
ncbi:winged helix-turn-helix domain-containing protein [uncultured Methylibium sp.]|uniref:winged helix-turn-helix domain-containing protein n=1 Tax=uncultured Methylibium sp. TaxID=381093 RepID=UPI0025E795F4|nr:winged helix-turn-helix domain-containing protein [uncultured Methylibium sp.]